MEPIIRGPLRQGINSEKIKVWDEACDGYIVWRTRITAVCIEDGSRGGFSSNQEIHEISTNPEKYRLFRLLGWWSL